MMLKFGKYTRRELFLRIVAIILAAFSLITSSVCLSGAELIGLELLKGLYHIDLRATNGWLLFICLIMIFFEVMVIMELFTDIRFLKIKIPIGGSLWYLTTIIKLVANSFFIVGYIGAAIPMIIFAGYWFHLIVTIHQVPDDPGPPPQNKLIASAVFVIIFSVSGVVWSIVMAVFILLAKFKYRCSRYDPSAEVLD